MSLVCPFDWESNRNNKLKGGHLLATTDHRFAYGFTTDGQLVRAFIASKQHGEAIPSLWTVYPDEMAYLVRKVVELIGDSYNVYANEGHPSGMTVGGHAHLHVLRRGAYEPASGMGLGKLVAEYNELYCLVWDSTT